MGRGDSQCQNYHGLIRSGGLPHGRSQAPLNGGNSWPREVEMPIRFIFKIFNDRHHMKLKIYQKTGLCQVAS